MAEAKPWRWNKVRQRWIYDYQNRRLGIPRSRAAFKTELEAEYFHTSVLKKYLGGGQDDQPIPTFGEILADYLDLVSAKKSSHKDNLSNASALRWPYEWKGSFYRLEELLLDDTHNGIITGLDRWIEDQKKVVRRCYLDNKIYQLRNGQWFYQPRPEHNLKAKPRSLVKSPSLIEKLNQCKGRGPFTQDTLKARQQLAAAVMKSAYKKFRMTKTNLADYLVRISGSDSRENCLNNDEQRALIRCASNINQMYGKLVEAAIKIGWRRANLEGLTWSRVIWSKNGANYIFIPKLKDTGSSTDKTLRRDRTKNGDQLITVMDESMEELLIEMQALKHPESDVVFHDGDGKYWNCHRNKWEKAKQMAGIQQDFRWHDLRHTWASNQINSGLNENVIQEQQGWKTKKMVGLYAHKHIETRAAELKKRNN